MADTTTPVTGTTPTPQDATQTNDLEINLADISKTETQPAPGNLKSETNISDLDLSLDLNLPDAPKDDDRLKTEDQKNKETTLDPINKIVSTEDLSDRRENEANEMKSRSTTGEEFVAIAEVPVPTTPETTPENKTVVEEAPVEVIPEKVPEPVVELTPEIKETPAEVTPEIVPEKAEEVVEVIPEPSSKIEELSTSSEILGNNLQKSSDEIIGENPQTSTSNLQEDMKIIEEMEGHTSAGGLAPEAIIAPQPTPTEAPKTFDLDAMLGTVPTPVNTTENPLVKGENEANEMKSRSTTGEGFVATATTTEPTPQQKTVEPQVIPAFTTPIQSSAILGGNLPTSSSNLQLSSEKIIGNNHQISSDKTTGVKVLLFVVLFVALGFTTFFILKTMYPIEFASIFNGGETPMHAVSEEVTGTMEGLTGEVITGEIVGTTGEIISEENSGDAAFGELNDLTTTVEPQAETDVSRLTEYLTKGNDFVTQGNAMNNNTVIKYGLYITKKSTAFLEKIANGEEINNLSGYFAQFDQYISQLENILSQTTDTVSPTLPTNESETTTGTTTETNTGITSE